MLVSLFLEDPGKKFEFSEQVKHRLLNIFNNDPKLKYWGNGESLLQNLEKSDNNLEAFITVLTNYRNSIKPWAGFILFKAERLV